MGEKRPGKARSIRKILEDKACLLREVPDLLTDMKFLHLMVDIINCHIF